MSEAAAPLDPARLRWLPLLGLAEVEEVGVLEFSGGCELFAWLRGPRDEVIHWTYDLRREPGTGQRAFVAA